MVQTRSQAAKNNAEVQAGEASTEAKQASKLQRGGKARAAGAAAEQAPAQPLSDKQLNANGAGVSPRAPDPKMDPSSHPLSSLPASLANSPDKTAAGSPSKQAGCLVAPEQQHKLEQALAAAAAAQAAAEQQAAGPAVSAAAAEKDGQQQAAPPAAEEQQQPAPAPVVPIEQPAAPQQQAQPPAPLPRPEKLLKPLPDKPVQCDKLPDGPEPERVDVEYVARADLQPVEDTDAALAAALPGLEASDWLEAVKALNTLRQLVVHHPDTCSQQLDKLMPLVLKSVRSLRSSLCKTAIMAVADLYLSYGDALAPLTDVGGQLKPMTSLLAQILLKCSSNDKKFVIEEAQRALQTMVECLTPALSLPLLLPYADIHKNPKVRGKASGAAAEAVARMQPTDVAAFGLPQLLKVAGKLVTDNTPDARDSAKKMIGLLKVAFSNPAVEQQLGVEAPAPAAAAEGEEAGAKQPSKWEVYCQANLSGSAALAVLKASSDP